jgi:transposase
MVFVIPVTGRAKAMIKITLSEQERIDLERTRGQSSSKNSEKALMVLMSAKGQSPIKISEALKRNPHTVRKWLKQYAKDGEAGLQRQYSPGRPNEARKRVQDVVAEILEQSPLDFGYQESLWTVSLMVHYLKNKEGLHVSEDTVTRALKEMGYRYKRPGKRVGINAPAKEEKAAQVQKIIAEIQALQKRGDCEIFALDESHFSTEPYLVRGWQKKRWPPPDTDIDTQRKSHVLWLLESKNEKILLEKIKSR